MSVAQRRSEVDATIGQLHWLPIDSPSNGSETRIRKTAERLTDFGEVYSIHPCESQTMLTDNLHSIPVSNPLLRNKRTRIDLWYATLCGGPSNPYHRFQTEVTKRAIRQTGLTFDLLVSEGPQTTTAALELASEHGAPVLINKHNAMYVLLDQLLEDYIVPERLKQRAVRALQELEQSAINRADAVVFQSDADREAFTLPEDTEIATIPNGTDYEMIRTGGNPHELQRAYGLPSEGPFIVFVGSFEYAPNRAVANLMLREFAPACPDAEFLLVGRDPPSAAGQPNVHALGFVDDLPGVLQLADIAICPLQQGRGTKLKMMDYLAAGLPIVTTSVGAEGIDVVDGENVRICDDMNAFVAEIQLLVDDPQARAYLATQAATVGKRYAWSNVLEAYAPIVNRLLGRSEQPPQPIPE